MLKRVAAAIILVIATLAAASFILLKDRPAEPAIGEQITIQGSAGKLVYHRLGAGQVIVLLPSFARSTSDFNALARTLSEAGYRTLAMQPRGIGGSTLGSLNVSLRDYAADVAAMLDAEGVPDALAVIGHAYGNRVARMFALQYPDRASKLVLLAAGGNKPPPTEISSAIRTAVFGLSGSKREQAIALAFFAGDAVPASWLTGWYPLAALQQARATSAQPYASWSHGGKAPMLILQPADDRAASASDSKALAEQLGKRIVRHLIPKAGHALLPEQPEAVAAHILSYLREEDEE